MLNAAVWGVVAFVLSTSLTLLCMPLARRVGAVARPREDRWARTEIPLLGGIAIAIGTVVPLAAATLGAAADPERVGALLLGGLLIALVGLVDDLRTLRPQTKLLGQLLAATLAARRNPGETTRALLARLDLAGLWAGTATTDGPEKTT